MARIGWNRLLRRRSLWALLYAGLIAYGVYALVHIPIEVLPAFDFPRINIVAQWPGTGVRELEQSVTRPLEAQLLALPGLQTLRSAMQSGIVTLTARFPNGSDPRQDLLAVSGALARAKSDLPPSVVPRAEVMGNAVNEVADYAVAIPPTVTRMAVRMALESDVLPLLRGLPGVQRVELIGGGAPSLWVQPNPLAMAQAGLTMPSLAKALGNDLVLAPAGYFDWGHQQVLASIRHEPRDAAELARSVVFTANGKPLSLASVARVVAAPEPTTTDVWFDGRPSIYLAILKQQGASTLAVDGAIADALAGAQGSLPSGAHFVPVYRQAHVIRLIGRDLGRNLIVGGLLAILVLALLMGAAREVWILALTIPLSLLSAIAVLHAFAQSLDLMTLGALTVAVGLMADDGIIVLESIVHEWEQGHVGADGIRQGLAAIALPDLTGTLTTIAVFLPLLVVGGLAGLFTAPFALAMIAALAASLVVSLTLVPLLAGLRKQRHEEERFYPGRRVLLALRRLNFSLLARLERWPRLALVACILFLAASFASLALLPFNPLPLPNEAVLLDSFTLPPGTTLPSVEAALAQMNERLQGSSQVAHVLARIGSPARSSYSEPSNAGEIQLVLEPGVRASRLDRIATRLERLAQLPGLEQSFDTPTLERVGESLSGLPQPFAIRIAGSDVDTLERLTREAERRLRRSGELASVFANDAYPVNRLSIEPRPAALAAHRVSATTLSKSVELALGGKVLGRIPLGNSYLDLYLRLAHPEQLSPEGLGSLPVGLAGHRVVPLDALAAVRLRAAPSALRHFNGARMLEITAQPGASFTAAAKAVAAALAGMKWPAGYGFTVGGLYPELEHTVLVLLTAALVALALMVGLLLLHFDDWLKPALILLEVPLAFAGGAAALAIAGLGLNLLGMIGFITLIGISLNHAIVLFDRVRRCEALGEPAAEAVREAVAVRFRPILLTTLTAILGALPTALGWGAGAAPEQGLAVVLVGGMLWTSLLSTNLIPALYAHWRGPDEEPTEGAP